MNKNPLYELLEKFYIKFVVILLQNKECGFYKLLHNYIVKFYLQLI